ncbi:MAG: Ig-like domain-containing protein [Gemmatimonadetes bacterium]|nr:Ig-like domain-containing protein [Gemmatimonadota bacterium]
MRSRLGVLSLATLAACTSPVDTPGASSIQFGISQDSVLLNRTYQTTVSVRDINGAEINGKTVKYESLFPAVATVDDKGLVTPKAVGQATIKATVDGRTAQANIKVLERVTRVVVTPANDQVAINQTRAMVATVTGASGQSIGGRNVTWRSSNTSVATVNSQGIVSGIALGTVTITASVELDAVDGSTSVTVINVPVASVALAPSSPQILRLGSVLQVTATPRDANNNPITGRTVTWSSSNTAVATVSASGLVTPLSVGQVSISAEVDGRISPSLPVSVTEVPPKSVTLTPDTVALQTSGTRVLTPTVIDSLNRTVTNLTNRLVVWSSSAPAVASVSSTGTVTALTAGTTRVSLTVDGLKSNDVIVNVTDQVVAVQITPSIFPPMRVGGTLQLSAQALNNQNQPIAGKTITWTSLNPAVATVSTTGLVTGVAVGNATITASVDQRSASVNVNVTPVPIGTVTLVPSNDTLAGGDQKQYNPVVTDSAGRPVTNLANRSVTWNSTNIPVASVSSQGIVQATTSQNGSAVITVTIDNVTSNAMTVRVAQIVQLQVTPNPLGVTIGTPVTLSVLPKDNLGNTLQTTKPLTFTTANNTIATVSPAGVVSGVAAGTTTIFVTMQGVPQVSVPVTVSP